MPTDREVYERLAGIEGAQTDIRRTLQEMKPKIEEACTAFIRQDQRIRVLEEDSGQRNTHSWAIILALIVTALNTMPNVIRWFVSMTAKP